MNGELIAKYDCRNSFYGKAVVFEKDGSTYLESYGRVVLGIDKNGKAHRYWNGYYYYDSLAGGNIEGCSPTTLRHIWEFVQQYDDTYNTKISDNIRKFGNKAKWYRSLPVENVSI